MQVFKHKAFQHLLIPTPTLIPFLQIQDLHFTITLKDTSSLFNIKICKEMD